MNNNFFNLVIIVMLILFPITLIAHIIGHFIMQSSRHSVTASRNIIEHTALYTIIQTSLFMCAFTITYKTPVSVSASILFAISVFILHFIPELTINTLSVKQYSNNKLYGITGFWSIFGIGQLIHILSLYYLLKYFHKLYNLIP